MSVIAITLEAMEFNRTRTLATLEQIEQFADPVGVLGWRPGAGRAHAAWQLLHIGITEELFATERLFGTTPAFAELVPRFKGGSTPDEQIPPPDDIRTVLAESRNHLKNALQSFSDDDLQVIPEPFRARGWTLGQILQVLTWHEPHHQGQAHLSLNLWKAAQV